MAAKFDKKMHRLSRKEAKANVVIRLCQLDKDQNVVAYTTRYSFSAQLKDVYTSNRAMRYAKKAFDTKNLLAAYDINWELQVGQIRVSTSRLNALYEFSYPYYSPQDTYIWHNQLHDVTIPLNHSFIHWRMPSLDFVIKPKWDKIAPTMPVPNIHTSSTAIQRPPNRHPTEHRPTSSRTNTNAVDMPRQPYGVQRACPRRPTRIPFSQTRPTAPSDKRLLKPITGRKGLLKLILPSDQYQKPSAPRQKLSETLSNLSARHPMLPAPPPPPSSYQREMPPTPGVGIRNTTDITAPQSAVPNPKRPTATTNRPCPPPLPPRGNPADLRDVRLLPRTDPPNSNSTQPPCLPPYGDINNFGYNGWPPSHESAASIPTRQSSERTIRREPAPDRPTVGYLVAIFPVQLNTGTSFGRCSEI